MRMVTPSSTRPLARALVASAGLLKATTAVPDPGGPILRLVTVPNWLRCARSLPAVVACGGKSDTRSTDDRAKPATATTAAAHVRGGGRSCRKQALPSPQLLGKLAYR